MKGTEAAWPRVLAAGPWSSHFHGHLLLSTVPLQWLLMDRSAGVLRVPGEAVLPRVFAAQPWSAWQCCAALLAVGSKPAQLFHPQEWLLPLQAARLFEAALM